MTEDWIYGHDVVQGGQPESPASLDEHRVVLGVTIGCRQEPEEYLRCNKGFAISGSLLRTEQEAHDGFNPRAAVRLVFTGRGRTRELAEVLLRKPEDALAVVGASSIEPLNDEGGDVFEVGDFTVRGFESQRVRELGAQPFILHGAGHIEADAPDSPHRQLENVGGGRRTVGDEPAILMAEEGGLLLGASQRYSELLIG